MAEWKCYVTAYRERCKYEDEEYYDDEDEPELRPRGHKGQLVLTFLLLAGIAAVAIYWVAVLL